VRVGERIAALLSAPLGWAMVGPAARYRPIEAEAVAAAMVRVAKGAPPGTNVYESDRIRQLSTSA